MVNIDRLYLSHASLVDPGMTRARPEQRFP